jgi:multicomponent Na+:H+ antiporter subunit D
VVEQVPALSVAVPVLAACALLAAGPRLPRPVVDGCATAAAGLVALGCADVLLRTRGVRAWIGGWGPPRPVGIALVADPVAAGLVALAALLTVAALVFSWQYFASVEAHFHVLVLLFLAGMAGFAFAGDLFTMIVFFELMGAVAYALTGYKVEEPRSVQAAFAFGVINSLGAYLALLGLGLLYARTGQLGLAQLRVALGPGPASALEVAALVLVCTGFLVKAATVPFHFWLADAHAVAPTPVCVLFSGVMAELGLYGTARVLSVVFGGIAPAETLRPALLALGSVTAVVGAVMCVIQRHLKRMLACSTIAHIGLFLLVLALASPEGTIGVLLYAVGHAGFKGMLFLVVGVLLDEYGTVDEVHLHGRAGARHVLAWLFPLGALALAGMPPTAAALGKATAEEGASGQPWVIALLVAVSAVTGGTALRAALRIHFGLGKSALPGRPSETTSGEGEQPDVPARLRRTPATMLAAIVGLGLLGLVPGLLAGFPEFGRALADAAARLLDGGDYARWVLSAADPGHITEPRPHWTATGLGLGLLSTAGAVAVAAVALHRPTTRGLERAAEPVLTTLHRLHSGNVGDYVAWLLLGLTAFAALVVVSL